MRRGMVVIAAAILLAYSNSFRAGLTLDNTLILLHDPRIQACTGRHLWEIFAHDYWWPSFPSDLYRPLTTLSFLFNYAVLHEGPAPLGYHWINLLFHALNAGLVWWLVERLGASRQRAFLAALIFAVHPAAVEAVTNLVGRADLLATACVLSALHFHISARRGSRIRREAWWSAEAGLALAGVLCKETGIVVLGFVALYEAIYRGTGSRLLNLEPGAWAILLPVAPACAVFALIRVHLSSAAIIPWQYFVDNPIARAEWWRGFLTAWRIQGEYLRILLWPARLSCDYSYNQMPLFGSGNLGSDFCAVLCALVLPLILAVAWISRRRRPTLAFAVCLYSCAMFPTSNLAKTIGSIMAERFLYLPLVGFAWLAAATLDQLGRRLRSAGPGRFSGRKWIYWVAVAAIVGALAIRTHLRNRDWHDDLSLWRSAVAVSPNSFKAHRGLAGAYLAADPTEAGVDAALAEAEKGAAILDRPDIDGYVERRDTTLFIDLGHFCMLKAECCARRGALQAAARYNDRAVAILRRAGEVEFWVNQESRRQRLLAGVLPEEIHTLGRTDLHQEFAIAFSRAGRFEDALACAEAGARLALPGGDPGAWTFMADCLRRLHRPEDAAVCDFTALLIDFHFTPAWRDLIEIYPDLNLPEPPVRQVAPGRYALDLHVEAARRQLIQACVEYDRLLRRENYPEMAAARRKEVCSMFHFEPGIFPGSP